MNGSQRTSFFPFCWIRESLSAKREICSHFFVHRSERLQRKSLQVVSYLYCIHTREVDYPGIPAQRARYLPSFDGCVRLHRSYAGFKVLSGRTVMGIKPRRRFPCHWQILLLVTLDSTASCTGRSLSSSLADPPW